LVVSLGSAHVLLNTATQELKQLLNNNRSDCIQTFLQGLTPTESADYSLWKATKKIKPPPLRTSQGTWARSNVKKAHAFAEHLGDVFQPHPSKNEPEEEEALTQLLETPYQLEPPINHLKRAEVQEVINSLNPKKSSSYDLITGKILKKLPVIGIKYLTQLFNAVLLKGYFPAQWKVAQIILILKPGKPPKELTSYRPIILLPIVSKVFEKLLLKMLFRMVKNNRLISNHQLGFRQRHSTIEQTHRSIFSHQSSFRQSMAYWTSVQVKTVSPSELFPYPKILFA
jgi:hypothetical protein